MDLPVWQKLYTKLQDQNFMVITVAMESRGTSSAGGPIRKSKAAHPSLIDEDHVVAELYNMVNVPQAVWIDEAGRIVRPTEVPGAALSFNLRKMRQIRAAYIGAIKDWVAKGEASEYAFSPDEARAHLPEFTEDIALAHTYFHLGRYLHNRGDKEEGMGYLRKATELSPDSWNFFRQMKNLQHILGSGGPEFMSRARRASKAGKAYYALPDMAAMEGLGK
jgi:tetratricopeptide (TPR) repeat protein